MAVQPRSIAAAVALTAALGVGGATWAAAQESPSTTAPPTTSPSTTAPSTGDGTTNPDRAGCDHDHGTDNSNNSDSSTQGSSL